MALTGMTLARVEGTVALRAHFGRFPDLSLSGSSPRSGVINLSGLMVRPTGAELFSPPPSSGAFSWIIVIIHENWLF